MKKYLIRYAAEIGTKNKTTRWDFIKRLGSNIKAAVYQQLPADQKGLKKEITISAGWNNTFLISPVAAGDALKRVHGIQTFSEVTSFQFSDYRHLIETSAEHFKPIVNGKTYAVRCKKGNRKDIPRLAVEKDVGTLLDGFGKVDLTQPDVTCHIALHGQEVLLTDHKQEGPGGLPLGIAGKALTLISGGIDSPVAAWRGYHAGIDQDFVYFDLGGKAQFSATVEILKYLRGQWAYGSKGKFMILDFKPVIAEILNKVVRKYQNMALKYCFYTVGDRLCRQLKDRALITGEAIGQVSTQTMANLNALDQVVPTMVIRPVVTYSKAEISTHAAQIGTYDMAYKGKEFCAIAAKGVVTNTTYEKLMEAVAGIDNQVLQAALDSIEYVDLRDEFPLPASEQGSPDIPADAVVIDLRPMEEFKPGDLPTAKNIPFQQAWADYIHWEKDKKYYLVCSEGSSSAILAQYMQQDDFDVSHLEGGLQRLGSDFKH